MPQLVKSKRVCEIFFFSCLDTPLPNDFQETENLISSLHTHNFLFRSAFSEIDLLQKLLQISLLYRNLYKIRFVEDNCCPILVIFRDLPCFIHKNVLSNSMYMITFIKLGSGAIKLIFTCKVPFLFCS